MRVKISKDEIQFEALCKKASAYYDDAQVEAFINNFGITSDNLLDSNGKPSENTSKAFVAVTGNQVSVLQKLAMDDFGIDLSYDEAISVLETVLPGKLGKFLNVEIPQTNHEVTADDVVTIIPKDKDAAKAPVEAPAAPEAETALVAPATPEAEGVM